MTKFNELKTRNDLARILNVPIKKLTYILYKANVDNLYSSFEIPKKNGEPRKINAPADELKDIQRKLAKVLWEHQQLINKTKHKKNNISHAFQEEKSIITNAIVHKNKRYVLNLDLKDFFDSIHFGRVKGFFEKNNDFKVSTEVATVIAQLSCYKGQLPQGAPTSPILTNLICNILDYRISKIAKKYRLDYTRYADDLTFSTNNRSFLSVYEDFSTKISQEILSAGFSVNESKTSLQFRDSKQVVTGLIVNKRINVDRNYYKKTRAMAHSLYTSGSFEINTNVATMNQLEGRFSFIDQLEKFNNSVDNENHTFFKLSAKEKQYQKFLFYKYFFANEKPLVVTEGKTDIRYLKAALKNLYNEYPDLITKTERGFQFKISFFKRSKRARYFLNVALDGADTMQQFYKYYHDEDSVNYPNYNEIFKECGSVMPKQPVLLIFDNELGATGKPINAFISNIKLSRNENKELKKKTDENKENKKKLEKQLIEQKRDELKEELKKELTANVLDNLYLITNPLVDGKTECEIEDLFEEKVLKHKINGRSFDRKGEKKDCYGKDDFSKFIEKNYKSIDFSKFRPIFNCLNKIVSNANQ
ncbi:retron Ec67 family RNA-directed DNA polymerase/endonuclease [Acetobacterium carbinolicum]|uniref:retron Ec67 family RNA-directed DNA polymerase/endonuclease n=1 Tax=Acetobacterium carbinolicum TaxID=52690 RepID=UPI0039BF9E65